MLRKDCSYYLSKLNLIYDRGEIFGFGVSNPHDTADEMNERKNKIIFVKCRSMCGPVRDTCVNAINVLI